MSHTIKLEDLLNHTFMHSIASHSTGDSWKRLEAIITFAPNTKVVYVVESSYEIPVEVDNISDAIEIYNKAK